MVEAAAPVDGGWREQWSRLSSTGYNLIYSYPMFEIVQPQINLLGYNIKPDDFIQSIIYLPIQHLSLTNIRYRLILTVRRSLEDLILFFIIFSIVEIHL